MPKQNRPNLCGEYVRFLTADGLELQGLLFAPQRGRVGVAVVHVHGWDGNFYENRFIDHAARIALEQGLAFFAFNNRGHDYVADLLRPAKGDYVQVGGIYERFADCVTDIRGALAFLGRRGFRRFVLQGHSHGAIKVAHYLAKTRDKRVTALVLLSPSDDLAWGKKEMGRRFGPALSLARRLVRSRRERQLMPQDLFPYPVSAGTFLDCFAPDSVTGMFNLSRTERKSFPELTRIDVPTLLAAGTVDEAFVLEPVDFVRAVGEAMTGVPSFEGAIILGAPHNYLGYERKLAGILRRWLKKQAGRNRHMSHESTKGTRLMGSEE